MEMLEPFGGLCLEGKREMQNSPGGSERVTSCMSRQYLPIWYFSFPHAYNKDFGAGQAVFGPLSGYELINTPLPPRLEGSEALHNCRLSVLLGGHCRRVHVLRSKSADRTANGWKG